MDRSRSELIQLVNSLKGSIDGLQLSQRGKDVPATSSAKDNGSQSGQGILGATLFLLIMGEFENLVV
ncbi:hypothetical protein T459_02384 [Capsicum annuum]|uniref:Uncharacterized protein n=1 Tax=Capsicum annuum TaxID=4072 RepID=A0A2G3AJV0_CAPAN|nr:hypothetical protein T459_02384 [Capsicum annuum]